MEAASGKWSEAIELCRGVLADRDEFDRNERNYKLVIAGRVQDVVAAARRGESLGDLVRAVFRAPNNLVNWRASQPFQRWVAAEPDSGREAILHLAGDAPVEERVDR